MSLNTNDKTRINIMGKALLVLKTTTIRSNSGKVNSSRLNIPNNPWGKD